MLQRFVAFCIDRRALVAAIVVLLSAPMLFFAAQTRVGTHLADLLPADHPYVAVHERFKTRYGSANAVTIVMEVEEGEVFRADFLRRLQAATLELRAVEAVNAEQVISLASRKLRSVRASAEGLESKPLMFPDVPSDHRGLRELRQRVIANDLVYGTYVSRDLKAALITVDFYDHLLNPPAAFAQLRAVMERASAPGIRVRIVGEPVLAGWVAYYLAETLRLLAATLAVLGALLLLVTRSLRGTLLPALAGVASAVWALGFAALLDIALDPLAIVVAFLITARAISHSVQLVNRFDDEIRAGAASARDAAKAAMAGLFKPGMLGVVADAACMLVVMLMPIPLVKKLAIIAAAWMLTIALSAVVMTPLLLSWVKLPLRYIHGADAGRLLERALSMLAQLAHGRVRHAVLAGAALLFAVSFGYALRLNVGDSGAGSPLLHRTAQYNLDAVEINRRFPGSASMFVVVSGGEDAVKRPEALQLMTRLKRYMEAQPGVGGSVSIADSVATMKRLLRDGNHRYHEPGRTAVENGELLYMLASGADASDMERYADRHFSSAAVTFFFRDRAGETVRNAVAALEAFRRAHAVDGLAILLAGGLVGVTAAVNEVILAGHLRIITLALLALGLCCAFAYRAPAAAVLFMVPVVLSNTLTFGFMAWRDIGLNIHTLPIAALGIGLGVDYSFYVVDAMREALRRGESVEQATRCALVGAGKGVAITGAVLVLSLAVWSASSLRFQSEMALLMALWLTVSAASALVLMPALVVTFKPRFIFDEHAYRRAPTEASVRPSQVTASA